MHKLERLSAFVGCVAHEEEHAAQFLICRNCGKVTEIEDHGLAHALDDAARRLGFTVGKATIEAEGQCAACAAAPARRKRRMPLIASAEQARANRRRGQAADGVTFWHTLYLGTTRYNMAPGTPDPEPGTLFPMAFLVEQDPDSVAHAHFHQADQFQVVVDGRATLGTHAVAPVTVHFAGAYTAYGPIRASEAGVHYFTLRNGFDPGARFMERAENRAALRSVPDRRHREAVAGPLERASAGWRNAAGPGPGRAGRVAVSAGAGRVVAGPPPADGAGQYWLVLSGGLHRDGGRYGALSCGFMYPDDAAFAGPAGPDGLDVLAMQFPSAGG